MAPPVVIFLTDYGLGDEFVGVCHAVILGDCPAARIIDLTHGVARHDVRAGALILARALPFLPSGAVLLAVVDPGVGSPRRALALRAADGRMMVGPDNGLLWPAAQACGGIAAAVDLADTPVARTPVSATFHGRDVFAPTAAALAGGRALAALGRAIDPAGVVALSVPAARMRAGELIAPVLSVDTFGNLALAAGEEHLAALGVAPGETVALAGLPGAPVSARIGRTFADVAPGELVLYLDPSRRLSLAVNRGSAAQQLGLGQDAELRLARPA